MKFIEYVRYLQNKYNVSNSEILEELNRNNISITKSALSHKLSGERTISPEEFEIIIKVICPSGSEKQLFRKLYKIYKIGEETYDEILFVKEYIESFGEVETPYIADKGLNPDNVGNISDRQTLGSVLLTIMTRVWSKESIKIICQPEYRELADILICLSSSGIISEIQQIVCFDNSGKSLNNMYNIQCIKILNNLILKNPDHRIRYYYDDVSSHINSYSLFPFFVIAGDYAVVISHGFESGFCFHEGGIIARLNAEFDRLYNESQELFETIKNDFEYMKICTELERQTFKESYVMQYHPCVIFNGNIEIAQKCIKESFLYKEEMISLYAERLKNFDKYKCNYIYNADGLVDFMETGLTTDLSSEMFEAIPLVDRKMILEKLKRGSSKHMHYEVEKRHNKYTQASFCCVL